MYRPIVVMGPAGTGKSFILRHLQANYNKMFVSEVSYTTRGPRRSERNGIDYCFISEEEFERMV
jgi:guanylate kinase